jgi:uncharacterized protein (TIGR02466 family)
MNLIDLFPTSIGQTTLRSLNVDAALQFIETLDFENSTTDGSYSKSQDVLSEKIFEPLKTEIESLCIDFAKSHGHRIDSISICSSWVNRVEMGQIIHNHVHANSYISGCFYLTEGSAIEFYNKNINDRIFNFLPEVDVDQGNYRTWASTYFNIVPGDLLLFPSNLSHAVRPHNLNKIRLSIAFNTLPIGLFGGPSKQINICHID